MHAIAIKASTIVLAATATMVGTAGVVTYEAGAVRVSVVEKRQGGEHVNLIVPAVLVPVALAAVPAKNFHVHDAEMKKYLPLLKAVSQELARCPDATLVEVKSPDEHVKISKQGNSIYIDVDDPGDTVHISFPVGVIETVINKLEAGNPSSPPVSILGGVEPASVPWAAITSPRCEA